MFDVPPNVKRGDQKGAPINAELLPAATTNAALVRVEWRFADDGQPPVVTGFPEPRGHAGGDWTYTQGIFLKPMVAGEWFVEVRVTDANGCVGVGRSATRVRVFQ